MSDVFSVWEHCIVMEHTRTENCAMHIITYPKESLRFIVHAFPWKCPMPCGAFCVMWETMWALSSSNSGDGTSAIDAKVFSPIRLAFNQWGDSWRDPSFHPDQWEASNLVGTQSVTNLFTFHKKLTTTTFIIHSSPTFLNNRWINWSCICAQQAEASIWVAQMKMFVK